MKAPIRLSRISRFAFAFIAVLTVSGGTGLRAQGTDVRGVISDSATAEKLPFANVVLVGTGKGAATNINGFYLIPNVPPGQYDLAVSSVGYHRKVQRITVGAAGPLIVNVPMQSQIVELAEIVVTEAGKRELREINTSVHVLDQKDIKLVPVAVQEDVFRSIQLLPGVVSTSDVNSKFYVRGGGGDQNLILLDGMKIFNPFHAFGIFSIFDADIIKTTEMYTGAFPPGYGGRLSSVVSMTTRDGSGTRIAGRANANFLSAKLQMEGPVLDNFRWFVNVRQSLFSGTLKRFLDKSVPLDFYDLFFKVTHDSEKEAHLSAQGFFSGDDLIGANQFEPDYHWRTQAVGGTASGLIQDRLFMHAVAYENTFEASRDPKRSLSVTPASSRIRETGMRAEATYYSDNLDLYFFGFEFAFPNLEYKLVNSYGASRRLHGSRVDASVWFRYQANLGDWKLDAGLHTDLGSVFERSLRLTFFQPRINASYALGDSWRLKGSYGRFNQNIITVNNEDDVISIFDAWIPIPKGLQGEEADHYVAGLDGSLLPMLSFSLQGYYKYYGTLVTYNREKIDAADPDYINSEGRAYGMETLLRYASSWLDVYTAYTLGKTTILASGLEYPPRYDRRHTLNILAVFHPFSAVDITLRWEFGTGFPFSQVVGYYDRLGMRDVFGGGYVGETGKPYALLGPKNAARLPSYHRLDVSTTYRFSIGRFKGTAGLHVINAYNHKNIFYFDRATGQEINMLSFFPSATLSLEY